MPLLPLFLLLAGAASEPPLRQGLLALERNNLPLAQTQLELAAKAEPGNPIPWLGLARVYWRQKQSTKALAAARKAEQLGPDQPVVLEALTRFYAGAGQPRAAAERATKAAAGRPERLARAAQLWLEAGQPQQALELARQGLAREQRADLLYISGAALAAQSNLAGAEQELRAALQFDDNLQPAYFALGQLLLQQEQFAPALAVLQEGRRRFPQDAQLALALGVTQYGLRQFPQAAEQFLQTAALAPDIEQPYLFLGRMLDQVQDRLPEFEQRVAAWAQRHPRHFRGPLLQAKALQLRGGDQARTEELLRRAITLNPKDWESHFELGVLHSKTRQFAAAAAQLQQSIALNPREPAPHYHLARVYDRLGQPEQAAAERQRHAELSAGRGSGMAPEGIH